MKVYEKLALLILPLICFSGGTLGLANIDLESQDDGGDFKVLKHNSDGFDEPSSGDSLEHWEELKEMFQYSLLVCQGGMNEASSKLKELFDSFTEESLPKNIKGVGHLERENAGEVFDEDVFFDLENVFQETAHDIGDEQFSDLLEDPKFGKKYLRHVEKILSAVEHACSSLPKILPNPSLRISRSPEDAMRRTVFSLTKWTERWVDYVETKLDKLIDICIANKPCKPFLIKTIERLVAHLSESEDDEFSTSGKAILQDLVNEIKVDRDIDPRPLSPVQKMALSDYFGKFQQQEESAYNLAGNIHDVEDEEPTNVFDDALVSTMLKLPQTYFSPISAAELEIETKEVIHEVPDTFLSIGFDSSIIQKHWGGLKKKYEKLLTLASALSPSMLRVGGSAANFLIFDPSETNDQENDIEDIYMENKFVFAEKHPKKRAKNQEILESIKSAREKAPSSLKHPKHKTEYQLSLDQLQFTDELYSNEHRCKPHDSKEWSNFTMTGDDMHFLVKLVNDLDWSLLFGLNQFWRDSNDHWDPTNARVIIEALKSSKNKVIYLLGNEPNAYHHSYNRTVSPEQAAKDYKNLKKELREMTSEEINVVGPEVTRPRKIADIEGFMEGENTGMDSMEFLEKFLAKAEDSVDAITWHQYYINGKTATLEDFMSPAIMNLFPRQLEKIAEIKNKVAPNKPIWITETASAFGGGTYGLSNGFVGGFLWLDKLGAAALGGADVVVRQTLYGGCYALLDEQLEPVPNYWISLLHKTMVGQKVLLPRARLVPESVRIYAQCLNPKLKWYKKGAVVVFGMNVSDKAQKIKLVGEDFQKSNILKFDLTAANEDLVSRHLLLNGKLLELTIDGKVPDFIPEREENFGNLTFQPFSMQFTVLIDAAVQNC